MSRPGVDDEHVARRAIGEAIGGRTPARPVRHDACAETSGGEDDTGVEGAAEVVGDDDEPRCAGHLPRHDTQGVPPSEDGRERMVFSRAMIQPGRARVPGDLRPSIERLFDASAAKIDALEARWRPEDGAPVFTVEGRYRARGWTEWTQGFQFGSALLQFDATDDRAFLELGRSRTCARMAPHLTHVGVHDHGFNNVSTYGALRRLAHERRFDAGEWEVRFYDLALQVSGAVQARRWTRIPTGGFIYSFNGAHSLFVDTIRSLRALAIGHLLGHRLVEEQDAHVDLLDRLVEHARATAEYNVYYGKGRDSFDLRGRVAHESLFNVANGSYPRTEHAAGLFPIQHLDARTGLGARRLRGGARVRGHPARRGVRAHGWPRRRGAMDARSRARHR